MGVLLVFKQSFSLFLVKFQTKKGVGNSSLKYVNGSRGKIVLHMGRVKILQNACDCKQATKQHKSLCPFTGTSIIKDQIIGQGARSLGIKHVSLPDINVDVCFYGKTLSSPETAPTCCYEKDLQFFQKI